MPFNSVTYHTNKHRRRRAEDMAKARAAREEAFETPEGWGAESLAFRRRAKLDIARMYVRAARSNHRLFMMYRRFKRQGLKA